MPLATAPFPPILFIVFFILPVILLLALLAGVAAFFYVSRKNPKVWGAGVAVLTLYGLFMTWTAYKAGLEQNYFVRVTACDDKSVVGQTEEGEIVRLKFSRFQNRQWGELPQVQTINAAGEQGLVDFNPLCQMISEEYRDATVRFETNGLNKIQRVWFLSATD